MSKVPLAATSTDPVILPAMPPAPIVPSCSVPALIVVPPRWLPVPVSVSVPVPTLLSAKVGEPATPSWIVPLNTVELPSLPTDNVASEMPVLVTTPSPVRELIS